MQKPTRPNVERKVEGEIAVSGQKFLLDEFACAILEWFDREGRKDLPWQIEPSPYRVWVSEIMLQQTQVMTVIPYFERFTACFPTLDVLAHADLSKVLEQWAGLGYYARARNLHRTARLLATEFTGVFPDQLERLAALPGIGRSTAGAIMSLGHGQRAAILDGNVKRVLSRFAGIGGWSGEPKVLRELWQLSEDLTPVNRVAAYNQGMMDLGATLCTRQHPDCYRCPLQPSCVAYRRGQTGTIPAARPKKTTPVRQCFMLVLQNKMGAILMRQRPPTGIWGGLWSLPEFECETDLLNWCQQRQIDISRLERMAKRRHTFTHYHLEYFPVVAASEIVSRIQDGGGLEQWLQPGDVLPMPTPILRLVNEVTQVPRD